MQISVAFSLKSAEICLEHRVVGRGSNPSSLSLTDISRAFLGRDRNPPRKWSRWLGWDLPSPFSAKISVAPTLDVSEISLARAAYVGTAGRGSKWALFNEDSICGIIKSGRTFP